jgi:F-type H+-transporting ATPase subunit a
VSNDPAPAETQTPPSDVEDRVEFIADERGGISMRTLAILIVAAIAINVAAFFVFPPFDKDHPEAECGANISCLVNGTLHFPRPHEVWVAGDQEPATGLVTFQVSLTDSLFTMLILTLVVLAVLIAVTRRNREIPGFFQNFAEWAYESMSNWSLGMGGSKAKHYIPIFAAFFVLILAFNWSGLLPGMGILPWTRAPTSDLNVTVGLAMAAFLFYHFQGFKHLGFRGYMSKFFPLYEFKNGIGAGAIAMFVGIVEFVLEFVKPVTLSMRLFGNIFGGEVALGVVIGLAGAFLIPIALFGLEIILTFVQALIFSTLTLMFILAAIESHHHEEGHAGEEAMDALEGEAHHSTATA